jgi:hypothetical protein
MTNRICGHSQRSGTFGRARHHRDLHGRRASGSVWRRGHWRVTGITILNKDTQAFIGDCRRWTPGTAITWPIIFDGTTCLRHILQDRGAVRGLAGTPRGHLQHRCSAGRALRRLAGVTVGSSIRIPRLYRREADINKEITKKTGASLSMCRRSTTFQFLPGRSHR